MNTQIVDLFVIFLQVFAFVPQGENPKSLNVHDYRKLAEQGLAKSDWDAAIKNYTEVLRLDPKDVVSFNRRGIAWQEKGNLEKAIADHSEAIRLAPDDYIGYHNRGIAWMTKGNPDKAVKDYSEAIRLDPKFPGSHYGRGLVRSQKGETNESIQDFDEAIRLDPTHAKTLYARANERNKRGELDKAMDDINEAIKLMPKDADVYFLRGMVWHKQESYGKAVSDFTESIRLNPSNPDTWAIRAFIQATCPGEKYRDGAKAIADAERACRLSKWSQPKYLEILAAAHAETGDFAEAIKWQKKAAEHPEYKGQEATRALKLVQLYEKNQPYRAKSGSRFGFD